MTKETLIEKINKLLAKANCSSISPEESAAFFGKAHSLMLEHKIEQAELDLSEDETPETEEEQLNQEDKGKRKLATWKAQLGLVLSKANGCFIYQSGSRIVLTGKKSDTDTVRYLYQYCVNEIDRLTATFASGYGRTYSNNFRLGCVDAIRQAIKAEVEAKKQKYASNERALVVINQAPISAAEAERHVRSGQRLSRSARRSRYDGGARSAGQEAGSNIYGGSRRRVGNQRLIGE